jgi:hypothetical protein
MSWDYLWSPKAENKIVIKKKQNKLPPILPYIPRL